MSLGIAEDQTGSFGSAAGRMCLERDTVLHRRVRLLPRLNDLPIPERVQVVPGLWGEQMIEMADHIGGYHTLLIHDRYGGQRLYVPKEETMSPVRALLGHNLSSVFSDIYARQYLQIAPAKKALARARRAGVIAAVRAGRLSAIDAAMVLESSRPYVSHLVHETDEGVGVEPVDLPIPRETAILLNVVQMLRDALSEAGFTASFANLSERIIQLGDRDSQALRASLPSACLAANDGARKW